MEYQKGEWVEAETSSFPVILRYAKEIGVPLERNLFCIQEVSGELLFISSPDGEDLGGWFSYRFKKAFQPYFWEV